MNGPDDLVTPRGLHPAFYGCFDWHSAVEMHWTLVRLLRLVPDSFDTAPVVAVLNAHLTTANLTVEVGYFRTRSWERPYGWGWALTLAAELTDWARRDPVEDGVAGWATAVDLLARPLAEQLTGWIGKVDYPTRDGAHANTAFALVRALPYARQQAADGKPELLHAISAGSRRWYAGDTDYPARYEPGGSDFLSGALTEAELMSELLEADEFAAWFAAFLPDPKPLFTPATVSDATDGQITHLHGLNLYRAAAFRRLAPVLGGRAADARRAHLAASLPAVVGGDWMAEHWLAAYAMLALG
jgi:hypothetical protein